MTTRHRAEGAKRDPKHATAIVKSSKHGQKKKTKPGTLNMKNPTLQKAPTKKTRSTGSGRENSKSMKKYKCGMCPSCYQRDACPTDPEGLSCSSYLPPEPTKSEWPQIYIKSLLDAAKVIRKGTPDMQCKTIGNARIFKRAMKNLHGFTAEEIKEIEMKTKIPKEVLKEITGE